MGAMDSYYASITYTSDAAGAAAKERNDAIARAADAEESYSSNPNSTTLLAYQQAVAQVQSTASHFYQTVSPAAASPAPIPSLPAASPVPAGITAATPRWVKWATGIGAVYVIFKIL
jgi:hypothetical protein